jgi:hypothetical protein
MDDATLAARQLAGQMAAFEHNMGSAGLVLRPALGVLATVLSAVPERSLPNSVVHADAAALTDAVLDELQASYDQAGVRAWTVWTRPGDDALSDRLVARGHVHDGRPALMAAELDAMDITPRAELEWVREPSWELVGHINDRATDWTARCGWSRSCPRRAAAGCRPRSSATRSRRRARPGDDDHARVLGDG